MLSTNVKFNWLALGASEHSRPEYDRVLYETENFAALPSLGSLVPNWVLIVPKRPMPNLKSLTSSEYSELENVSKRVTEILGLEKNRTYNFEHGGQSGSVVSCGVDQAHLHLVELPFDLMNVAQENIKPQQWFRHATTLSKLGDVLPHDEYLMVGLENEYMFTVPSEKTSQWFRKVIANELGQDHAWDYKVTPNYSEVWKTEERFMLNCQKMNKMN